MTDVSGNEYPLPVKDSRNSIVGGSKSLLDLKSSEVSLPNAKINKLTNTAHLSVQRIH